MPAALARPHEWSLSYGFWLQCHPALGGHSGVGCHPRLEHHGPQKNTLATCSADDPTEVYLQGFWEGSLGEVYRCQALEKPPRKACIRPLLGGQQPQMYFLIVGT